MLHPFACHQCGRRFERDRPRRYRYCSPECSQAAQRRPGYDDYERKVARRQREASAPGLRVRDRRALLQRWKAQGRGCAYCGGPAETVDHVIPLSRGGDNYEGNLVPACLSCNSIKKDRLLVEWRTGRPASATSSRPRPRPKPRRIGAVRGVQSAMCVCAICGGLYAGPERKTCGDQHCRRELIGRLTRDRYRAAHGHPVDPSEPTLYWIRLHGLPDTRTRVPYRRKAVA